MHMKSERNFVPHAVGVALALLTTAHAQTDAAKATDLAQQLQNPIADLISVPIQNSWDFGMSSADAMRFTSTIQPIYPINLSEDWNLVSRTIIPFIDQESTEEGGADLSGLGDITESLFFSPSKVRNGWVFGGGPIFQLPTATEDALGSEKWGAGPTAVALRQSGPWSYGLLFNHVWSFAGNSDRSGVSNSLANPWLAYTTKSQWTFAVQTESTYDWTGSQWTIPVELQVAKLVMFGQQPVQFTLAARDFVSRPEGGPDWGLGFNITFLFPK